MVLPALITPTFVLCIITNYILWLMHLPQYNVLYLVSKTISLTCICGLSIDALLQLACTAWVHAPNAMERTSEALRLASQSIRKMLNVWIDIFNNLLFPWIWREELRYSLCKCSNSVPFGAYSNTIILVNGSSSSQNPMRFTKFLWFTFDNISIWKINISGL